MSVQPLKIFLDGADLTIAGAFADGIDGFTTNPTLLREAGITSYQDFIQVFLSIAKDKLVSFEVVADEFDEMEQQAHWLQAFGRNVYVKIPITNSRGESSADLIARLAQAGIQVNVTAIMTPRQIQTAVQSLRVEVPSIISVFAGRIADTGRDPMSTMHYAFHLARESQSQVLWASAREVLNVQQAEETGCDIITLTPNLLTKLSLANKDLTDYSLETVQMFRRDALAASLTIPTTVKT